MISTIKSISSKGQYKIFSFFFFKPGYLCNEEEPNSENDEIRLLIEQINSMPQTQRRNNRLDLNILSKILDDLTNIITSLKLA